MRAFLHLLSWITFFSPALMAQEADGVLYKELHRPRFHFSTPKNWINDPNGLVFFEGEYHLFYQHNPLGNEWGHMSWGHAVSRDLVHWEHLPLALEEENGTMIFSGTVVVDQHNSAGLSIDGRIPMIAIYTGHREGINQAQFLAFSLDKGRTWKKYGDLPVLDLKMTDFRDPKVFWYQPGAYWVMVAALPLEKKLAFFRSPNLREWSFLSHFGPAGDTTGIWECPDLFPVRTGEHSPREKWVLMLSPSPYMQYFTGEFDGIQFKADTGIRQIFRPDYGTDYYAAIVFNNLPADQPPVSIGWLNNWRYANKIPTHPWKGAMSIPRQLSIHLRDGQWKLLQQPVTALQALRSKPLRWTHSNPGPSARLPFLEDQWEMKLSWIPDRRVSEGIRMGTCSGKEIRIAYDPAAQSLSIQRGDTSVFADPAFRQLYSFRVPVSLKNGMLSLHIFRDHSLVEIFVQGGEQVISFQAFTAGEKNCVELFGGRKGLKIESLEAWFIRSIWNVSDNPNSGMNAAALFSGNQPALFNQKSLN